MSTVVNIGTAAAAAVFVCAGDPDPAKEYSAACFDQRDLHDVCAGIARDGEACVCPCHKETAPQEDCGDPHEGQDWDWSNPR